METEPPAPDECHNMRGFTLKDATLVWALLEGHKKIENRNFRITPGWYAVHLAAGSHTSVDVEQRLRKLFPSLPSPLAFEKGVIHGVCRVTGHREVASDPAIARDEWYAPPYKIANCVGDVAWLRRPVVARGNLGVWPLDDRVRREVCRSLQEAKRASWTLRDKLAEARENSVAAEQAAEAARRAPKRARNAAGRRGHRAPTSAGSQSSRPKVASELRGQREGSRVPPPSQDDSASSDPSPKAPPTRREGEGEANTSKPSCD